MIMSCYTENMHITSTGGCWKSLSSMITLKLIGLSHDHISNIGKWTTTTVWRMILYPSYAQTNQNPIRHHMPSSKIGLEKKIRRYFHWSGFILISFTSWRIIARLWIIKDMKPINRKLFRNKIVAKNFFCMFQMDNRFPCVLIHGVTFPFDKELKIMWIICNLKLLGNSHA